jgi:hypothetical protein
MLLSMQWGEFMIDNMESVTANFVSFARAYHSNHEKCKNIDDYLAYDLEGKEEYEEIRSAYRI